MQQESEQKDATIVSLKDELSTLREQLVHQQERQSQFIEKESSEGLGDRE